MQDSNDGIQALTKIVIDIQSQMQDMQSEMRTEFKQINTKLAEHDKKFDKIDEKFDAIDKKFDAIDARFDQQDETTTSFYSYVEDRIDKMDYRFDRIEATMATKEDLEKYATKEEFDQLKNSVDSILKHLDIDATERLAISNQVDRHEDWIEEAAPKVGVKYTAGV